MIGNSVWKSDGTAIGTIEIKQSVSTLPVNVAGTAFFVVRETDAIFGTVTRKLWKSDGTPAGTVPVKTLPSVSAMSQTPIGRFTAAGNRLFFALDNTQDQTELWTSDGTDGGTMMLKMLVAGISGVKPQPFVSIGNTLFFTSGGLWKTDGTVSGTLLVKATSASAIPAEPSNLYAANGIVLFGTKSYPEGVALWRSDGTEAGTQALKTFTPLTDDAFLPKPAASITSPFVVIANTLYFIAVDGVHGFDLWKSDGTAAGTTFVKDTTADYQGPYNLMKVGNRLFFTANDGVHGYELWTSDGTAAGTQMVKDINADLAGNPNVVGSGVRQLVDLNGTLYFIANDDSHGAELWKSDGTAAGTVPVTDLNPGVPNSVYSLAVAGNKLFLQANNGLSGIEIWTSDGTTTGTTLLKDIVPGADGSQFGSAFRVIQLGNALLFTVQLGPDAGLWQTDGTTAGTTLVKAGVIPTFEAAPVSNGKLFFLWGDTTNGPELWASDGTALGTRLVKDITPGPIGSFPEQFTDLKGMLVFSAVDGTGGSRLWKSDGTEAGTLRLDRGTGSTALTTVAALTALPEKGIAVFAGTTLQSGSELWQTDGTAQGTALISDIASGPASAKPYSFTLSKGTLYFAADDWKLGVELWRYDFATASSSGNVYLPLTVR